MNPISPILPGSNVPQPITIGSQLEPSFANASQPTAICNQNGFVLGTFVPAPTMIPDWITPELLAECDKEEGDQTLSEIMKELVEKYGA